MNTIPLLNPSPVRKRKPSASQLKKMGESCAREYVRQHGLPSESVMKRLMAKQTKKNPSKMEKYKVLLGKKEIDIIYQTNSSAEEIRRSLVHHDGYDPRIVVKKVRASVSPYTKMNPSQTKLAVRALDRSRTKTKYGTKAHIPGLRYKAEGITASGEKVVSRAHTLSAANTSRAAHKAVKGAVTDTATGRVMTVLKAKRQHKRTGAVKKPLVALRKPTKKPSKRTRK